MMTKLKRSTRHNLLHNDDGNLPSAAVFVVVLALLIVATSVAVNSSAKSIRAAAEATETMQRQASAVDNHYVDMLNNASTLPKGESLVNDEGRVGVYQAKSSGAFKGFDAAGQPIWNTTELMEPIKLKELVHTETLNCGLDFEGVLCWGKASKGEAGNGSNSFQSNSPVLVIPATQITFTALFGFKNNLCGIEKTTGMLWCWGANTHKTFGAATTVSTPVKVGTEGTGDETSDSKVVAISDSTFCMVARSKKLLCNGVLDADSTTSTALKTMKGATADIKANQVLLTNNTALIVTNSTTEKLHTMVANANGAPGVTSTYLQQPKPVPFTVAVSDASIVTTATGDSVVFSTLSNMYGFGSLYLGDGTAKTTVLNPTEFSGGALSRTDAYPMNFVQTPGGTICVNIIDEEYNPITQCWGEGSKGEIGDSHSEDRLTPVQPGIGYYSLDEPLEASSFMKTDGDTICAIYFNREGFACWGDNSNFQATNDVQTEIKVVDEPELFSDSAYDPSDAGFVTLTHGCKPNLDFTVECWGNNVDGGVGVGINGSVRLPLTTLEKHVNDRPFTTVRKVG